LAKVADNEIAGKLPRNGPGAPVAALFLNIDVVPYQQNIPFVLLNQPVVNLARALLIPIRKLNILLIKVSNALTGRS